MTNGIIIFPAKKVIAALPTDWEVGGGPPGAAYLLVMTSFKRFNGNMFKSELLNCQEYGKSATWKSNKLQRLVARSRTPNADE